MYKEKDIVREGARHWILRVGIGHFEVLRYGATASTRCATIHFSARPEYALERANAEMDRREALA